MNRERLQGKERGREGRKRVNYKERRKEKKGGRR